MDISLELIKAYEDGYKNGKKDGYEDGKKDAIRYGKWLNEPPYTADGKYLKGQECSVCHSYFVSDGNKPYSNHPYCPQCGAKMEECSNA